MVTLSQNQVVIKHCTFGTGPEVSIGPQDTGAPLHRVGYSVQLCSCVAHWPDSNGATIRKSAML